MEQIIYVFVQVVYYALFAVQFLMLMRALCSIFIFDEDSKIANFLYYATEPIIYPVRRIFEKFGGSDEVFLDIPFLITMMLIMVVQAVLPTVRL